MFKSQTPGAVDARRRDSGKDVCLEMLPGQRQGQRDGSGSDRGQSRCGSQAGQGPQGTGLSQRQVQGGGQCGGQMVTNKG